LFHTHVIHPVAFPRGVASPDGDTGFIELSTGGVAAISLSSGAIVWQAPTPARPRLVMREGLVAQDLTEPRGNVLRFLLLNISGGGSVVLRTDPVPLPDWVSVNDPEQNVHVDISGHDGHLTVTWHIASSYQGGAPPPAMVEARSHRVSNGTARIDLATGSVTQETNAGGHIERGERVAPIAESAPYLRDLSWHDSPWPVGDVTAALAWSDAGGRKQLLLRRWPQAGRELAPVTLSERNDSIAEVTPDGHDVFVRAEPATRPDAGRWDVFSVIDGQKVGSVPYEDGATWPCVIHGRVFYLVEATRASAPRRPTLKAFDPTTGLELWSKGLPEAAVGSPPARRM
jgi:hypothetical protein